VAPRSVGVLAVEVRCRNRILSAVREHERAARNGTQPTARFRIVADIASAAAPSQLLCISRTEIAEIQKNKRRLYVGARDGVRRTYSHAAHGRHRAGYAGPAGGTRHRLEGSYREARKPNKPKPHRVAGSAADLIVGKRRLCPGDDGEHRFFPAHRSGNVPPTGLKIARRGATGEITQPGHLIVHARVDPVGVPAVRASPRVEPDERREFVGLHGAQTGLCDSVLVHVVLIEALGRVQHRLKPDEQCTDGIGPRRGDLRHLLFQSGVAAGAEEVHRQELLVRGDAAGNIEPGRTRGAPDLERRAVKIEDGGLNECWSSQRNDQTGVCRNP